MRPKRPALPACSRSVAAVIVIAIAALVGAPHARADIYTWVDEGGTMHVSNLTPPPSVRVTQVVRTPPAVAGDGAERSRPTPGADAATREAELRALRDRVRELERDNAAMVSRATAAIPSPVPISTVVVPVGAPVLVPYPVESPATAPACDPLVFGCPVVTTLAPTVVAGATWSPYVPHTGAQPVRWPAPNLAALGPWAPRHAQPFAPRHHARGMAGAGFRTPHVRP